MTPLKYNEVTVVSLNHPWGLLYSYLIMVYTLKYCCGDTRKNMPIDLIWSQRHLIICRLT